MKKNKPFAKQTSLRSKIMVPFVVIIAVMALASMIISIYSLTNTITKNTRKVLIKESVLIKNYESSIWNQMNFVAKLIPSLRRLTPDTFKDAAKFADTPNSFDWNKLKVYPYPDAIPESKREKYDSLIELGMLGEHQVIPHIHQGEDEFKITLLSVSPRLVKRNWVPVIAEYSIDTSVLKEMENVIQSNIALLFFGDLEGERRAELLTASPIISALPALQKQLKRQIKNTSKDSFFHRAKLGTTTYTIHFQQSTLYPKLYFASVKTSEEMLNAKIRIIVITILVLLLISAFIFGIYALIIQKITTSIDILSSVSEKIAKGDLEQHVYLDASDEIGELSNIFNQMVINLKDSSERLKREKERSEAIISCIPEGIVVTDLENRLILANHKAEDMFNFSLNEVQGKFLLEHINNEDMITVLGEKQMDSLKPVTQEVQIPGENNENHIYQLTSSLVGNNDGEAIGVITVLRDMTHDKQIEELREGFLRTVSHELRTPLTSVIGFIELVKSGINISDEQREFLNTALNEASNLKKLIDDLLDLSQIKAGKMKMQLEEVNVKELIDNVVTTLKPLAKGKKLKLTSTFKNSKTTVFADPAKLRRVFINLISNAIKFTQEGHVKISCSDEGSHCAFAVEDTGIGLREEEKDVIFEKFRQIDYSSTREYEGIGLGLSIVRQLVEMHNGEITVASEYTKGSTFTFTIQKDPPSISS
jgi:PAS domain S-box-containing protein